MISHGYLPPDTYFRSMFTLTLRDCASAGRYGFPWSKLRHLASSKPTRVLLIAFLCLILITSIGHRPSHPPAPSIPVTTTAPQKARFSLLIPATSSNPDLCKLLLSSQILNYPTPILINYGATEFDDPYVQHLAKVEGILKYLDRLGTTDEYAEDLVLIVGTFARSNPDVITALPCPFRTFGYYILIEKRWLRCLVATWTGSIVASIL